MTRDFSQIFWDCPKLRKFWENVKRQKCEILNINRPIEPQQLILGTVSSTDLGKNSVFMLMVLLLIAHKMITVNWLKPHPPTLDQWFQRLKEVNCMEHMKANLRLETDLYLEKCTPVIMYLER